MAQTTISSFFNNRKRPATDDLKGNTKVMALDTAVISGYGAVKSSENSIQQSATRIKLEAKATLVFANDEASKLKPPRAASSAPVKAKTPARTNRRATKPKDSKQSDLRAFLPSKSAATPSPANRETEPAKSEASLPVSSECRNASDNVSVQVASATSEAVAGSTCVKEEANTVQSPETHSEVKLQNEVSTTSSKAANLQIKQETSCDNGPASASTAVTPTLNTGDASNKETNVSKMPCPERKESNIERARRELSLGDIKSKLTRSARLAELKASLARFDEGRNKLKQIEQIKQSQISSTAPVPQLNQFDSIQLEVPASPSKSPMKSPLKSPLKNLSGSRSPAFQRYSSLTQPGTPGLPLPFSYRHLAELFRCVDRVVSLMFNRGEIVTFNKLQPAVQEMSRKTFTTKHLAQMMAVYPAAYTLKQEKVRSFGTQLKNEKYQLIVTPVVNSNSGGENNSGPSMTASVLIERTRRFFNNLLDIVKKHHQEFLQSLDPPMVVPMEALSRWHPQFAVDEVPEVSSTPLPQPPDMEKCHSAKDVLEKAKQLYSCNARMERALESVAQSQNNAQVPTVNVEVANPPASPSNPPTSPFKSLQLTSRLKGIPKALLEKIRAKEAARALESMTRTSAQDKEATQYARLPELARILRNVYVAEKKDSLKLESVLEKVGNSYRSALEPRELEVHFRLLAKAVPGWLTFDHLLETDYLKLRRKADINRVVERLNNLASSK